MKIQYMFDAGSGIEVFTIRFALDVDIFEIIEFGYAVMRPHFSDIHMLSLTTVFD